MATPQVQRTILYRLPLPNLPGWESRTVLLDYPPGAVAPPHTHPVTGVNYIVQGSVLSEWEHDGKIERFEQGEIFLDHAEKLHTKVENPSKTDRLLVVVTYILPEDEANVKFVPDSTVRNVVNRPNEGFVLDTVNRK